jgi:short-subunit dehydrogenase
MGNILSTIFRSANAEKPLVILITGASAGMGKEMALTMIRRGHIVYGGARRVEQMQDLVAAGGYALKLDVANPESLEQSVKPIMKEQGKIDVLVNNAGISVAGSAEDIPMERLRRIMEVNFFGAVDLTQKVLPHMRKAESGLIVNVSSVLGKIYKPFSSTYAASKHALEGWSDCLRTEAASFGISVSIFEPGFVSTELFDLRENLTPEDSPYKAQVDGGEAQYKTLWPKASHPSVVADALVHACESGRPKRRYVVGYMGASVLCIRNWLGDGFMDFFYRLALKKSILSNGKAAVST